MSTQPEQTLTITTRALARDKAVSVRFGSNSSAASGHEFAADPIPPQGDVAALQTLRGALDHQALMHRLHDYKLHRKARPSSIQAARILDALEEMRVDLLGGLHMHGLRHNIHHWYEAKQSQPPEGEDEQAAFLANALAATLHHQHTHIPPHPTIKPAVDHWQRMIDTHAAAEFSALMQAIDQQHQFAKQALTLMDKLQLLETFASESELTHQPLEDEADARNMDAAGEEPDSQVDDGHEPSSAVAEQTDTRPEDARKHGATPEMDHELEGEVSAQAGHNHATEAVGVPQYKVYTHQYDEVVAAQSLATTEELQALNKQLGQKLLPLQAAAARMANRLQRLLLAKQRREWLLDQEEGLLDSKRLTRLVTSPTDANYFKREKDSDFRDTVVTLLIDNSGSMRGRPISIAALSASILGKALERSGVKVEVLGFTTRDWKGGQAAKEWAEAHKPPKPGRLNDLRHIIYKSADQPWRKAQHSLGLMLKEGILKENIDGEAVLWAVDRLQKRPEERRILMVISDGAPVDDSTLSSNHGSYLDKHLHETIDYIENHTPIELLAIGIGHDVTRYYSRAITISEVETLPQVMGGELMELFGG